MQEDYQSDGVYDESLLMSYDKFTYPSDVPSVRLTGGAGLQKC